MSSTCAQSHRRGPGAATQDDDTNSNIDFPHET